MRIGFIGAGNIGTAHMEAFAELREDTQIELVAVTDLRRDVAEECAEKFKVGRIAENAEEMIADPSINALVIAVPNRFHAPYAIEALKVGKHLLLEKPMGANLAEARAIYDEQQRSSSTVMLCHQMRWMWWAQEMRKLCESRGIGEIYHARTGWMRRKGIPGWGTWFTQKEVSGGGPLIDIGVHMLDVTLHLLGNPKPVSVSGVTAAMFGPDRKGIGEWGTPDWDGTFDVEDFASAFVRFEDGRTLTLDVSWAAHTDRPSEFVELLGKEAGLSYYGGALKYLTEKDGEMVDELIELPKTNERFEMTREFLQCARSGEQPACNAWSGLVNNALLDAIYRSSNSQAEVDVDLPH